MLFAWACLSSADEAAAAKKKSYGWLAYGDLRGYLEPCGCDPDSDLGGVKRIRAVIERERRQNAPIEVFDLGNVPPPLDSKHITKAPFLIQAVAELDPDAALFNVIEQQHISFHDQLKNLGHYVLSNPAGVAIVKTTVLTLNSVVFGYVSPHSNYPLREIDENLINDWKKVVRENSDKVSVLLFSGTRDDLAKIDSAGIFDLVIRSNERPYTIEPDLKEKENERLLFDATTDTWQVPLGGQGILRGGKLMSQEALGIDELIQGKTCGDTLLRQSSALETCETRVLPGLPAIKRVTWLPRRVGGDEYYKDLFARYDEAVKKAFVSGAELRAKDLADSSFVGAETCKTCHPSAYRVWRESAHANAFATLKEKNKHLDGECISCHVLGAESKGGFVSEEASPHLANVQCETCHGPRKEHAANPLSSPKVDNNPKQCESCHHQPHSSRFVFESYWERIKHAKE